MQLATTSQYTLVRVQFFGQEIKELRAFFRRGYKLGDIVEINNFRWESIGNEETSWKPPRIVLDLKSINHVDSIIVRQTQVWDMKQCQVWKNQLYPKSNGNKEIQKNSLKTKPEQSGDNYGNHGSGLAKRQQASLVAPFLTHSTMFKLALSEDDYWSDASVPSPHEWHETFSDKNHQRLKQKAIDYLNSGVGVVDVAGGSGHVSMVSTSAIVSVFVIEMGLALMVKRLLGWKASKVPL